MIGRDEPVYYGVFGATDTYRSVSNRSQPKVAALAGSNALEFVRSAVGLEIAASRLLANGEVGPPIVTAAFDSTGLHFVDACHDQPRK